MTEFLADGVPGLTEGFLEHIKEIHFPAGKLVRVSFTGSGPGSGVGNAKIQFPFGTFTEPVLNLALSATGIGVGVTDPPTAAMIKNLYAWSTFSDEGNFVYYNTALVKKKFGRVGPVVIASPSMSGIPTFHTSHFMTWYYLATPDPPDGPLDPNLFNNREGAILANFDPTAEEQFSVGAIFNFINAYADGTASPGVDGAPALPIGDGGDGGKAAALAGALAGGSHIIPSLAGPNVYSATEVDSNDVEFDAGWGLNAGMFKINRGLMVPTPLSTVSAFDTGQDVSSVTITIDVNDTAGTISRS